MTLVHVGLGGVGNPPLRSPKSALIGVICGVIFRVWAFWAWSGLNLGVLRFWAIHIVFNVGVVSRSDFWASLLDSGHGDDVFVNGGAGL